MRMPKLLRHGIKVMNRVIQTPLLATLVVILAACASKHTGDYNYNSSTAYLPPQAAGEPGEGLWPRPLVSGTTTNFLYEPQVDSWNGRQLVARQAVALSSPGQPEPVFGVVTLHALTLVDKTKRTVSLENIQILGGDFPSARAQTPDFLRKLSQTFPKELTGLSLDRLEASFVAPPPVQSSSQPLNNTPPRFIVSTQPAILVSIDGPPVFRPVAGTDLQRVLNSRVLVLKDPAGHVYVHVLDGYMGAPSLEGPWTVAPAPKGATKAEQQAQAAATPVDLLDEQPDSGTNQPLSLTAATAPAVYVSTTPAELLVFEGSPAFVPIPDTHLLYAANTTANVFKSTAEQQTYVLSSGRWFRAPGLAGPWQYVPADRLPQDFASIPDNSPKENVKASVPGTPQATEAVIANSIPQSTKVGRTEPMPAPQIDGPPRLEPIAGTPLFYVANSGTPIIKVDDRSWYACQNGVWFTAGSLSGPWTVAVSVPPVIYTIPPNSPLHYLTYVQVYGATPEEVYEGYTPGYWGTEVEDGVVVYGTGYYYPPWIGDVWFGWPCTWGFGWGPCWNPWDDWCFDFGFGWGCGFGRFGWWGCHPPRPWGGPFHGGRYGGGQFAGHRWDSASTARNVYARTSATGLAARRSAGSAAPTALYGRAYNSRTGVLAAGQRSGVRNVYSGFQGHGGSASYLGRSETGYSGGWRGPRAATAPLTPRAGSAFGSYHGYGGAGFYGHGVGGYSGYSRGYGYGGNYSHGGWAGGGGHGWGGGGHGGWGGGGGGGHGGGGGGGGGGHGGGGGGGGGHR